MADPEAPRSRRSWPVRWLVRAGLLLASVAACELGLRVVLWAIGNPYDATVAERAMRGHLREFDGRTFVERNARIRRGEVPRPDLIGRVSHPFFGWQTLRARDDVERRMRMALERTEDEYVIWIFGGSVAGIFASRNGGAHLLIERLAADPRFAERGISTEAYALAAFKQPQQLMQAAYLFSLGLVPDAVINLDGFNEVALGSMNAEHGSSPVYPAINQWGSLAVPPDSDPAVADSYGALVGLLRRANGLGHGVLNRGLHKSALIGWCAEKQLGKYVRQSSHARRIYHDAVLALGAGKVLSGPEEPADGRATLDQVIDNWVESSVSLGALCAVRGVTYLHVLQPTLHDEGSKPLTEEEVEAAGMYDSWEEGTRTGYPLLRAAGERLRVGGVAFLDASAVFREVEQTLYRDGCHFNTAGNLILADAIAAAFLGLHD
ncbi:MAG: hypothetical protein GY711_10200 [bacterium]|nr:hypothetical protein [bacterium]